MHPVGHLGVILTIGNHTHKTCSKMLQFCLGQANTRTPVWARSGGKRCALFPPAWLVVPLSSLAYYTHWAQIPQSPQKACCIMVSAGGALIFKLVHT